MKLQKIPAAVETGIYQAGKKVAELTHEAFAWAHKEVVAVEKLVKTDKTKVETTIKSEIKEATVSVENEVNKTVAAVENTVDKVEGITEPTNVEAPVTEEPKA